MEICNLLSFQKLIHIYEWHKMLYICANLCINLICKFYILDKYLCILQTKPKYLQEYYTDTYVRI